MGESHAVRWELPSKGRKRRFSLWHWTAEDAHPACGVRFSGRPMPFADATKVTCKRCLHSHRFKQLELDL